MKTTVTDHQVRKALSLSLLDYHVMSGLQIKALSDKDLSDWLDVSPKTVAKSVEYLQNLGLLDKDRCVEEIWYDSLWAGKPTAKTNINEIANKLCSEIERVTGNACVVTQQRVDVVRMKIKGGYTSKQMLAVLYHKAYTWKNNEDMEKYIRFDTLFGNKFKGYISQAQDFFTNWKKKNRGQDFPVSSLYVK